MSTTTTATASPSTPTMSSSPSPSSDPSSSLFKLAGSPALVLAFLAVGILAGGLVSVLFFRRLALLRLMRQREAAALAAGDETGWTRVRSRAPLGPKPKLWDIECASLAEGRDVGGWEHVVPLAVSYEQPFVTSLPVEPSPAGSSGRQVLSSANALGRWVRGLRSSPPEQPPPVQSSVRVHVAVAVAMPEKWEGDQQGRDHRSKVPMYALGLTDIVWEADAIDSLISVLPSSSKL